MSMVACTETDRGLCVVLWIGRKGFNVKAKLYCGDEQNAADGVVQAPDTILSGAAIASPTGRGMVKICPKCNALMPTKTISPPTIG